MKPAWLAFLAPLLLCGCAPSGPAPRIVEEPRTIAPPRFATNAPVALVLSGGGFRGFAHVGVLKVLEENGIRPDIVVGASSGAIVGSLYASGLSPGEVENAVGRMDGSLFADFVLPGLYITPGGLGFVRGERLHRFMERHLRKDLIQDFPIAFAAVATDLQSGEVRAFNAGSAALAVRASSALPGVLTPVEIGGHLVGDGQIASPAPVISAHKLGARIVVAVDVVYPPRDALLSSPLDVAFQAFTISLRRLAENELALADIVIAPEIPPTSGQFGFSDREMLIAAGENATREALPRIRQVLRDGFARGAATGVK